MRLRSRARACAAVLGAGLCVAVVAGGWVLAEHTAASGSAMVYRAPAAGPHQRELILRREGARVVLIDGLTGRVLSWHRTAGLSAITIDGANGTVDNTLTVDLSAGAIDATKGIRWDGGVGGYNTLDVRGGGSARVSNRYFGPHSGLYSVGSTRIAYSHIAPVYDLVAGPLVVNVPLGVAGIIVAQAAPGGPLGTTPGLTVSVGNYESITFANKTSLVIQANSLDPTAETWVLDASTASAGLTSITFEGGSGSNKLVVDAYPDAVPLTTSRISTISPVSASFGATEGAPLSDATVGTFTDSNPTLASSAYTATVDWGDRTPTTSGTVTSLGVSRPGGPGTPYVDAFLVAGSHTYAEDGSYSTSIDVSSSDGSTTTLAGTATVADAALSAGRPMTVTGTEGTAFSGVVGSFTDANPGAPASDFSATIAWGDASESAGTVTQPGGAGTVFYVTGTHTYAEEGSYDISVSVDDKGGSTTTLTGTATVADAALSAGSPVTVTGTEGTAFSGVVGSFTDANPAAPASDFSATIAWGDASESTGTVTQPSGPGTAFYVTGTHTYAEEGSYDVSVSVDDDGGSTTTLTGTATVADAALDPGPARVIDTEGTAFSGVVGSFTDANPAAPASDFSVTIAWGDASESAGTVTQPGGPGTAFYVTGTHTYAGAGSYDVSVSVDDNGASTTSLTALVSVAVPDPGYRVAAKDGGVFAFGTGFYGSMGGKPLNAPIVGMAPTLDDKGYWLVAADGGIFSFGDAGFYGSMGGKPLNQPIVGMAPAPDGGGYWLVASDGGVFAFGDAGFYGSMGGKPLNQPIVGMAPAPDGGGYWLVASDGGVFAFGDAGFYGSMGGETLNRPIVGMAATPDGGGYWLVAQDGGVFASGDATFFGSAAGETLATPVVSIAADPYTGGYWLVAANGAVFSYGAPIDGSFADLAPASAAVAIAAG